MLGIKSFQWATVHSCSHRLLTKWVEAASFLNMTKTQVTRSIRNNIIYLYGLPQSTISDNVENLKNDALRAQFNIRHQKLAPQKSQDKWGTGGIKQEHYESFTKDDRNLSVLAEEAPVCVTRLSNLYMFLFRGKAFSLVCDIKTVLPVEIEILLLRILMGKEPKEAEGPVPILIKWILSKREVGSPWSQPMFQEAYSFVL